MDVIFRRLVDDDLPMLHRWLNDPRVVQWWEGDDVSWKGVVRDYGSSSRDPAEHWTAALGGRDIGWIQFYAAADYAHEAEFQAWWRLGVDRTAGGVDYLIADPQRRGRVLGTAMIRRFVTEVAFGRHPGWTQVCASPLVANVASWRVLEKAGFAFAGTFNSELGLCRLMVAHRPSDTSAHGRSAQTAPPSVDEISSESFCR